MVAMHDHPYYYELNSFGILNQHKSNVVHSIVFSRSTKTDLFDGLECREEGRRKSAGTWDCSVGGVSDEFQSNETAYLKQHETNPNIATVRQPELDHFMEAYCFALGKLKEAIEEPQQKSMAFINNMHLQLSELTKTCPAESTTTLLVQLAS
ncbi:hypothetical protein FEM48_Zijuj05G0164000 [Ziziphus jujuba var. spinosa]|uniref:KNOX2 domain-containing protein n=1 Tax=Ziziphus jujuba var. spinosa TaxID=714518 RepID=A0A978VFV5_ZIZJJ|nr:hypothetical protein FEM48_Zijuj05G0164000 [Ziziphus jujuba var. spinosa]